MATHSGILAWRIPWTEEPGRLQSMGSREDRHSCRVKAKNPALLSSRDGYLLELTGWTKGSQASEALERGQEIGL